MYAANLDHCKPVNSNKPRGGVRSVTDKGISKKRTSTYYYDHFLRKLYEIEKKCTGRDTYL